MRVAAPQGGPGAQDAPSVRGSDEAKGHRQPTDAAPSTLITERLPTPAAMSAGPSRAPTGRPPGGESRARAEAQRPPPPDEAGAAPAPRDPRREAAAVSAALHASLLDESERAARALAADLAEEAARAESIAAHDAEEMATDMHEGDEVAEAVRRSLLPDGGAGAPAATRAAMRSDNVAEAGPTAGARPTQPPPAHAAAAALPLAACGVGGRVRAEAGGAHGAHAARRHDCCGSSRARRADGASAGR